MNDTADKITREQLEAAILKPIVFPSEGQMLEIPAMAAFHRQTKNIALMMRAETELRDLFQTPDMKLRKSIGRSFMEMYEQLEPAAIAGDPALITLSRTEVIARFAALYHVLDPNTQWGREERHLIDAAFAAMQLGEIPASKYTENLGTKSAVNSTIYER